MVQDCEELVQSISVTQIHPVEGRALQTVGEHSPVNQKHSDMSCTNIQASKYSLEKELNERVLGRVTFLTYLCL